MIYVMSMMQFNRIAEECRKDKDMMKRLHTPHELVREYVNATYGLYKEVQTIIVR